MNIQISQGEAYLKSKILGFILKDRSLVQRTLITVSVVAISFVITYTLNKAYPAEHLFSVNLASSIIAAALGGLLPGMIACLIEALAVDLFFIHPIGSIFDSAPSVIRVVLYLSFGWFTCLIIDNLKEALKSSNQERDLSIKLARSRETILAVVSHDLRGPLSAISISSKMISKLVTDKEKASRYRQHVDSAINQMNYLIEDLLDASKIEKGCFQVRLDIYDLNELFDQALRTVQNAADEKSIYIENKIRPLDYPWREFDFNRLLQVLTNLLSNAIKFSPPFGKVILDLKSNDELITFSISDEGPGILPEDRDKIFQKFWQGEQTKHLGTGLGLFITKGIVEAHNGRVKIENSMIGATFSVELPLNKAVSREPMYKLS